MPRLPLRGRGSRAAEAGRSRPRGPRGRRRFVARRRGGRASRGAGARPHTRPRPRTRSRLLTRARRGRSRTLFPRWCFNAGHFELVAPRVRGALETLPSRLRRAPHILHATAARARRGRALVQTPATPAGRESAPARRLRRYRKLFSAPPTVPSPRAADCLRRPTSLIPGRLLELVSVSWPRHPCLRRGASPSIRAAGVRARSPRSPSTGAASPRGASSNCRRFRREALLAPRPGGAENVRRRHP